MTSIPLRPPKPQGIPPLKFCLPIPEDVTIGDYEVPENTIRQNYIRCKTEFDSDGVLRVGGEDLKEVRDIVSLSSFSPRAVLFPSRAVVRMGFILKDSAVAVRVRTATLNVLQGVGQIVDEEVLSSLILEKFEASIPKAEVASYDRAKVLATSASR